MKVLAVIGARSETVPGVVVAFSGHQCGPHDVAPGQTITCPMSGGGEELRYLIGRAPASS